MFAGISQKVKNKNRNMLLGCKGRQHILINEGGGL